MLLLCLKPFRCFLCLEQIPSWFSKSCMIWLHFSGHPHFMPFSLTSHALVTLVIFWLQGHTWLFNTEGSFPLPGLLFPQVFTWLVPHTSRLSLNVSSWERPSLSTLFKESPTPFHLYHSVLLISFLTIINILITAFIYLLAFCYLPH